MNVVRGWNRGGAEGGRGRVPEFFGTRVPEARTASAAGAGSEHPQQNNKHPGRTFCGLAETEAGDHQHNKILWH